VFKKLAVMAETATSVGRPVDRDSNKKSRCRLSVDRPVGRNKQRVAPLQSASRPVDRRAPVDSPVDR